MKISKINGWMKISLPISLITEITNKYKILQMRQNFHEIYIISYIKEINILILRFRIKRE